MVIPLGLQTVHSIVCEDLIQLWVLRSTVDEIMEVGYDLGGVQTSQFLFFNGNLVFDWFWCDVGDGGGGREDLCGEDCLNIVAKVTSTQDRVTTQPWTQGVKSGVDDNPGRRLCEASPVVMAPCSCSRGSLVSSEDSGGATVTLVTDG